METIQKCITPREKYKLDDEYLISKKYSSTNDLLNYNKYKSLTYDEQICLTFRKHEKKYIKDREQNNNNFIFFMKILFCCE